ncbi:hypothetical protein Scep_001782 [Stephania cephalantha]|uniref:Uncharacterized protein n=1 Tax=Stephania cephalantha TaxID=152367 RepID=A0AAP0L920_9MAGN
MDSLERVCALGHGSSALGGTGLELGNEHETIVRTSSMSSGLRDLEICMTSLVGIEVPCGHKHPLRPPGLGFETWGAKNHASREALERSHKGGTWMVGGLRKLPLPWGCQGLCWVGQTRFPGYLGSSQKMRFL